MTTSKLNESILSIVYKLKRFRYFENLLIFKVGQNSVNERQKLIVFKTSPKRISRLKKNNETDLFL